jgi:hypothetical protein
MRVPHPGLQFHGENFQNLLQGDLDSFAAAVWMALSLRTSILMLLISARLKCRGCLMTSRSASSILAIWRRPVRRRNRHRRRSRIVIHFGGWFLVAGGWGSRPPQNVFQKAKHVIPNHVLMDARRSFSVLAPAQMCLLGSASPQHSIQCLLAGQLFQGLIRMNHATKSRTL